MKMKCKEDTWRKGFDNPEFKKKKKPIMFWYLYNILQFKGLSYTLTYQNTNH